ncbi:MAG: efflux RND transporter periplasmic adaptor subunit [Candidatus Cloacimonadales bacterium]
MKKNILGLIIISMIFWGCASEQAAPQEQKIETVSTLRVQQQEVVRHKNFSGTMQAAQEANLGALLPGRVEKIYVEVGQHLEAGDLIAELGGELLTQAEIEYQTYQKDYQRLQRLYAKAAVAEMDLDHIKAKYEAAEAKYQMVKKSTEIRALFAGTVADIMVQEGENYLFAPAMDLGYSHAPGIVKLVNMDELKLEIEVNEKDLSEIYLGQPAQVAFVSYPETTFSAEIKEISPLVSHTSRTCKVVLSLPNPQHQIKPGMFARVDLELPTSREVIIPRQALLQLRGTGQNYLFMVEDQHVQKRTVEILYDLSEQLAVSNLQPGEEIVIEGKSKIFDGDQIKRK